MNATTGKQIESLTLYGEFRDDKNEIVEADVMLNIQNVGHCALTVMTKNHYYNVKVQNLLMSDLEFAPTEQELEDQATEVQPYVVNEDILTTELLTEKFVNKIVWDGLAKCLTQQTEQSGE